MCLIRMVANTDGKGEPMGGAKTKRGRNAIKSRRRRLNEIAEWNRMSKTQSGPVKIIKLTPEEVAEMIRGNK